ncbi:MULTISPECIES: tRNA 2-selenouridine(34) synthase MnmH [Cyanophyceae]|uniref:tRNA 2-selenouridine(34) synthase MnmH n=1 Tax=Cyanophyceae TaxID=3028117 RepID=UPI001686B4A4|nr:MULTISPECIES: tRNA 2-selenouridine(34) synthase MnmH [Cyanophyceae]MBD1917743.1 tRNA 2-selenouridine(34) synthase MnmH [Phormidium sp. FACHB-77]MBD2032862.1 tRNA 2-selenouridine(34) synthase MnmH [Phormidium sp. FACHB-322]MBD2051609.1 tRNA 2-selenouridine(34) synthase MnmH [Leptolyngbya sp. FACHB-60]
MPKPLDSNDFLQGSGPILDVRSPGEFQQGHIPGAISFPLFTDAERAQVGTCYKQVGRESAVELGFDIAGPKCGEFVRAAKALAPNRHLRIHCWRGGMRSGGMGWILELAGFTVHLLNGGYKAYRHWVRETLATPKPIVILGGMTGSGKTLILQELAALGESVLDLEGLANHRGSSFGSLLLPPQPSTEHYENLLADQWARFPSDSQGLAPKGQRPIWLEAESRRVGTCRIPDELFAQMAAAAAVEVVRSLDERLDLLVEIYGEASTEGLVEATERIGKRLGGDRTQSAVRHIQSGNLRAACAIILDYYDRTYRHDLERRRRVIPQVDIRGLSPAASARLLAEKLPQLGSQPVSLSQR